MAIDADFHTTNTQKATPMAIDEEDELGYAFDGRRWSYATALFEGLGGLACVCWAFEFGWVKQKQTYFILGQS